MSCLGPEGDEALPDEVTLRSAVRAFGLVEAIEIIRKMGDDLPKGAEVLRMLEAELLRYGVPKGGGE